MMVSSALWRADEQAHSGVQAAHPPPHTRIHPVTPPATHLGGVAAAIAAHVQRRQLIAPPKLTELVAPAGPCLREAVQQQHQGTTAAQAVRGDMQPGVDGGC